MMSTMMCFTVSFIHLSVRITTLALASSFMALVHIDAVEIKDSDGNIVCFCNATTTFLGCQDGGIFALPDIAECRNLTTVDLDSNNISDLTPLSSLTQLVTLGLSGNRISDLIPLSSLTQLTTLGLGSNQISDLTPLSPLTQLMVLGLANNKISDLTPLSPCVQLATLFLGNNQIADLNPLSALTQLATLNVVSNQISDVTPLSALTRLENLNLGSNQISDLTSLSLLSQLTILSLGGNQISALTPLSFPTQLLTLHLDNNQISGFPQLPPLLQLATLTLASNQIADLSPLSSLTQLAILDVASNQISDVTPLSTLTRLKTLKLGSNQVSNLTALSPLTELATLDLGSNLISDLTPLSSLGQLKDLGLATNQISNLTPLSPLTQITTIYLASNQISDLNPLSHLTQLAILGVDNNQISDLTPLSSLTQLATLKLESNQISGLTPLSHLTQLATLGLINNQISDLTPLSHLTLLHTLELHGNQISDLTALSPLTQLTTLGLASNQISDLTPLSPYRKLTSLSLNSNRISDLTPLSPLTQLRYLFLPDNQISDLTPLSSLTQLTTLFLGKNQISNLTPFSLLTQLATLSLGKNQISDLTPLSSLTQLATLFLDNNQISALTSLSFFTQLVTLNLRGNQISDLTPLSPLTQLGTLSLDSNQIWDLIPLTPLTQLVTLNLRSNQISDLTALSSLTQLTTLDLASNQISDLTVLSSLTQLTTLDLASNQISDPNPLSSLHQVAYLDLHHNHIKAVSTNVSDILHATSAFFMEQNPSTCIRVFDAQRGTTRVICDCALGFYGADSCASIQKDFLQLPDIVSKLSTKCYKHSPSVPEFCPSNQITDEILESFVDAQLPTESIFYVNETISGRTTIKPVPLSWVDSAFKVTNAFGNDYKPLPPQEISVHGGLYTLLDTHSFEVQPNPNIPTNITYNVSHPLPLGITFNNGSSATWFSGAPSTQSKKSIDVFNITVTAEEHFTGETKVAAYVVINVTACGADTCNSNGQCAIQPDHPYQFKCNCDPEYTGSRCDTTVDKEDSSFPHWAIAVIVLAMIGVIFLVYWYYFRKSNKLKVSMSLTEQLLSTRDEELLEIQSSWNIPWNDLDIGRVIGTGAFGSVVAAVWQGNEVAVKRMKTAEEDFTVELFETEVRSMTLLRHPNIVTFYGAGIDAEGLRFLVVEYLANGSLRDLLNNKVVDLSGDRRMAMCRDIALGMAFLHNRNPPVMHRDLKADNCFVSSGWSVKVGDFGSIRTSKNVDATGETGVSGSSAASIIAQSDMSHLVMTATFGCGTPLWMAPEVFATAKYGQAHYGFPADVYSYGIVMYEVATRNYPYADRTDLTTLALLAEVQHGLRPLIPHDLLLGPVFVELMTRCWSSETDARPSFQEIGAWFESNLAVS